MYIVLSQQLNLEGERDKTLVPEKLDSLWKPQQEYAYILHQGKENQSLF